MSLDFGRYLHTVDLPSEDQFLHHQSSCPSFGSSVFLSHDGRWAAAATTAPATHTCTPDLRKSKSEAGLHTCVNCSSNSHSEKCKKNVSNFELRHKLNARHRSLSHSCLRQVQSEYGAEGSGSVQNHWAAAHGLLASNLAVYLGRGLTLHSSPRIKRKSKKKKVKFADDYGETLVTFYIVPRIDIQDADYWSFIQQTVRCHERDLYQEECEDDDCYGDMCSSPDDTIFPWHTQFDYPHPRERSGSDDSTSSSGSSECLPTYTCSVLFEQPVANFADFQEKLEKGYVCLENVKVDININVVTCSIKVKNLHPVKKVFARCTSDRWNTFADLPAAHADPGYESSVYDSFSFAITKPLVNGTTAHVEFAIGYQVDGKTFWDNNFDKNYIIEWHESDL